MTGAALVVDRDRAGYAKLRLRYAFQVRHGAAVDPVPRWTPLPHQVPPEGDWTTWLLMAGRGAGKTDACAAYVNARASEAPIRVAIVAPTLGDAVEACVNGPSGLKAHNPAVVLKAGLGGVHVSWPNGSEAKLFGAHNPEDVERLRAGGNRHLAWAEELAAWRYLAECWQHLRFGLRLGEHPRIVASTTPKPRPAFKALVADPSTALTTATTFDNPHLAASVRAALLADYGGTALGQQELYARVIDDTPGALWTRDRLERNRVAQAPPLARVVVAVDPEAASGQDSAETGIVVAGLGEDGHGYVLDDLTLRGTPHAWGSRAVAAYESWQADRIVGEVNNGGEMVEHVIRTSGGAALAYKALHASRGKAARAEPVAGLDEQGKVHLVGSFPELEDQLCTWVPGAEKSPDRLDALVWALTELMLGGRPMRRVQAY